MADNLDLLRKFAPEIIVSLERRYNILRTISHNQPIGRRLLADQLMLGERIVRGELDFLKSAQLLISDSSGVYLTPECEGLLPQLGIMVHKLRGLVSLELYLAEKTGLDRVYIVPGDVDRDHETLCELGRMAGRFLNDFVQDDWVIAVTGGTTMAEVASNIPKAQRRNKVLVVPARGGLGEDVEIQANTIAARMAQRLGGSYRLLHVPDGITEEALERLLTDHKVQEVITLSKQANLLMHGIGVPAIMAKRRDIEWDKVLQSSAKVPVGEAFGIFFDDDGSVIKATPTAGPSLEELSKLNLVVAVAGGRSKARAIMSVLKGGFIDILITDQGAAESIKEALETS